MHVPAKHHHLPVFFLRRWTSERENGCVCAYNRPHKEVVVRAYPPGAIGYQKFLYTVPSRSDPEHRQEVESKFMSPLDARAAEALVFIEQERRKPEDPRLRDGWSRFIMSQLYRSPEQVARLRRKIRDNDESTMREIAASYAAMRRPEDPPNFEEYRTQSGSTLVEEAEAFALCSLINNQRIGTHINGMIWSFVRFSEIKYGLLTSDNPVLMSNGLGHPAGFLIIATGPDTLFMATNRYDIVRAYTDQPRKALERALNDAVVRQADRLVVGHTREHLTFVSKRLTRNSPFSNGDFFHHTSWRAPI